MKKLQIQLIILVIFFVSGCQTLPQITHENTNEDSYVGGRWNDSDARKVANEMINDCLDRPWLQNFIQKHKGGNPVVIIGKIRNQTSEHIDVNTFVESIQRALINSGRVNFVASKFERGDIREERYDQAQNSSEDTQKVHGQETGADYILKGTIKSIRDQSGGTYLLFYQVNLKLLHLESNIIAWNGEKKIRRKIQRRRWTY